jgi:ATP-dependent exoDNAse (exonuclease V) alpha subunit
VLEVIDADEAGITLRARTGKVGTVRWGDVGQQHGRMQFAYGYAITSHTAQGSTAKEHIFALPSGSRAIDGLSGYTTNTRHRHAGFIVTNEAAAQAPTAERHSPRHRRRHVGQRGPRDEFSAEAR